MKPIGNKLLIATHNAGKLAEFRAMLAPAGITVVGAAEMGLPEPAETEDSFVGNARIKARAAVEATGLPALADDSGLCVDALDGAPGVYTADWAETPNGRDFDMAMRRTWSELEAVQAPHPRTAFFNATFVLAWPDGREDVFTGKAAGHLIWPPRGPQGHGFDPMFVPEGEDRTYAELSAQEKNARSHRAAALAQLMAALKS